MKPVYTPKEISNKHLEYLGEKYGIYFDDNDYIYLEVVMGIR